MTFMFVKPSIHEFVVIFPTKKYFKQEVTHSEF